MTTEPVRVLDASALLCLIFGEPGAATIEALVDGSIMSAVNYAEVIARLVDKSEYDDDTRADLAHLAIDIIPLDRETAELAGVLRAPTRAAGLSLGDRCCLALARRLGGVAVTTDRAWARADAGVPVDVVR